MEDTVSTKTVTKTVSRSGPTLDDLPKVPSTFCDNAPDEYKTECIACMNTTTYTSKYTYENYGIQQGTTLVLLVN